jgi:hypothetical protein
MKANKLFLNVALFSILVIVIGIGIYKYRKENFNVYAGMTLEELQIGLAAYTEVKADIQFGIKDLTSGGTGSFQQDAHATMVARLNQAISEVSNLEAEIRKRTANSRSVEINLQYPCPGTGRHADECCKTFLRSSATKFRSANLLDGVCILSTDENTGKTCESIDAAPTLSEADAEAAAAAEEEAYNAALEAARETKAHQAAQRELERGATG